MDLVKINFKGSNLSVIEETQSIVVRDICEIIGVEYNRQRNKIKADPTYQSQLIKVQTNGGMQDVFCIPLNKLNGWLFSINPNKVKPEVKEKLIAYKEECFEVLHNHFMPQHENSSKTNLFETSSQERIGTLETQLRDTKRELTELRRLHNRASYNHTKYSNSLMNDAQLHNSFLEFLYQGNKAVHELSFISHRFPEIKTIHQSMGNFMFVMLNRYEHIRGIDKRQEQLDFKPE